MTDLVIGAQYYRPPNPPRADWDRDLRNMRAAGLNTVKLWACWSWMEPTPGGYDFADLDDLMELAGRHGLVVVINTILENAPYWLQAQAPHARYLDHEDRPVHLTAAMNTPGGGWPGLCFDHEEVWTAATAFLEAVAGRYAGHAALRWWDVWNEPHLEPASYFPERMYCYCDASLTRFREWLHTRYSTVDGLNRAWSRRYSDWSQVEPPRLFESVPDLLDWREFWFGNLAGWLARRVGIVRAVDGGTPVMTHVALSGFTGQLASHTLDEFTLTADVDAFGTSSFPTWLMGDDPVEHLFNLDAARGAAAGRPFWQAELQGGRGRRYGTASTPHPSPDTVGLWMWNALATGASGIVFWQWRPELLGPESPGYGLCAPDGEPTVRVDAVTAFAAAAASVGGPLAVRPPGVGLLVSRRSALHAFATDRSMELYRDSVLGAYRLLADDDEPVEVLHDTRIETGGVPEHITAIVWPMPAIATSALAGALEAFVRRGGVLLAEAGPGEYDERGARRPRVPGAGLDALFGVVQADADIVSTVRIPFPGNGQLTGAWQVERLRPSTADTLASFADGNPAVTRHRVGAGSAVLVATHPFLAYATKPDPETRAAITSLYADVRPPRTLRWLQPAPGQYSREAASATGPVVVAVNWSTEDQWAEVASVGKVRVPARSGCLIPR